MTVFCHITSKIVGKKYVIVGQLTGKCGLTHTNSRTEGLLQSTVIRNATMGNFVLQRLVDSARLWFEGRVGAP